MSNRKKNDVQARYFERDRLNVNVIDRMDYDVKMN